jgi:hypothetical protein
MTEVSRPIWSGRDLMVVRDDARDGWIARVTWRDMVTGRVVPVHAEAPEPFATYREALVAARHLGLVKGLLDSAVAADPPDPTLEWLAGLEGAAVERLRRAFDLGAEVTGYLGSVGHAREWRRVPVPGVAMPGVRLTDVHAVAVDVRDHGPGWAAHCEVSARFVARAEAEARLRTLSTPGSTRATSRLAWSSATPGSLPRPPPTRAGIPAGRPASGRTPGATGSRTSRRDPGCVPRCGRPHPPRARTSGSRSSTACGLPEGG